MRILRTSLIAPSGFAAVAALSTPVVARADQSRPPAMTSGKPMSKAAPMTKAEKIANAMAATPASISAKVTVLDWPAKEGEAPPG